MHHNAHNDDAVPLANHRSKARRRNPDNAHLMTGLAVVAAREDNTAPVAMNPDTDHVVV